MSTAPGGKLYEGQLQLLDGHGGASAQHVLMLEAVRFNYPYRGDESHYLLFFAYVAPGRYRDASTGQLVDRFPGDTFLLNLSLIDVPLSLPVFAKAVELVSSDIASASPGAIDASDLSALAARIGNCASFCTNTGCQPDGTPDYCTWRGDLNVDGYIDGSDLSVWAWETYPSPASVCNLSKADPADDLDRILSWFGMTRTGRTIVQLGREMPEIAIVNEAQMQVAIADPYGYRTVGPMAVQPQSWSKVKTLYR